MGPAAEYQFGTHQLYIHQSQNSSRVWGSAAAAITVAAASIAQIFAPQQAYADPAYSSDTFAPPSARQGPVPPTIIAAPQGVDLTLQGQIFDPQPSSQGPVPTLTSGGPLQTDLTLRPQVFQPQAAPQGRVPATIAVTPQIDLYIQPSVFGPAQAIVVVTQPVPKLVVVPPQNEDRPTTVVWPSVRAGATPQPVKLVQGAPQLADFTLQAQIFDPQPANQGKVPTTVVTAPQLDLTPPSDTFQSAITQPAPTSGPVLQLVSGAPQQDPTQIPASIFWTTPNAPVYNSSAEYQFGTHQLAIYESQFKGYIWGPAYTIIAPVSGAVPPYTITRPQADPTQIAAQLFQPLIGTVPPVTTLPIKPIVVPPQQYDFTLQAVLDAPNGLPVGYLMLGLDGSPQDDPTTPRSILFDIPRAPAITSAPLVKQVVAAPQSDPTQIQGQVFGIEYALSPPLIGPVMVGSPQADPTQVPGRVFGIQYQVIIVSTPIIPQLFAAPLQVDVTLQAQIFRPSLAQGRVPPLTLAAPQLFDFTLKPTFSVAQPQPVILGATVFMIPPVPPQPDLNVNYTASWTPSTFSPSAPTPTALYRVGGPRDGDSRVNYRNSFRVGTSTTSRDLH